MGSYLLEQMINFFESLAWFFPYLIDLLKFLQNTGFSNFALLILVCIILLTKKKNQEKKPYEL
jgi:uncharacterized membrane protein YoaT (DUF817 family)